MNGRRTWRRALASMAAALVLSVPAPGGEPGAGTLEGVETLLKLGRYAEGEAAARKLLADARTAHGGDSIEAARVIDRLVETLWRGGRGNDPEAQSLAESAVRIKQEIFGPEHPETAASLAQLGQVLRFKGRYDAARPLLERALRIRQRRLGSRHLDVAASLADLANLFIETEATQEARRLYERALAIQSEALGPDHPDMARNLKDLGRALRELGRFEDARLRYEMAIAIIQRTYGEEHPDMASSLNGLALVLEEMGDSALAKPLLERALALQRRTLGPDHFRVAASLNNLAFLLKDLGDYGEARPLVELAIEIWRKAVGGDHPSVATSMVNLAELLELMGDYDEANSGFNRALEIQVHAFGPDDPRTAWTLRHLARLNHMRGDRQAARPLYERALGIFMKAYGSGHQDVALLKDDLADLLLEEGHVAEARGLLEEALAIQEKVRGPGHPEVAGTLGRLASLLRGSGESGRARACAERALSIRERSFGPEHPLVAESLNTLAGILLDLGRTKGAFDAALRAEEIGRNHLRLTARTLPERQALEYAAVRPAGLDLALSLAVDAGDEIPDAAARAWNAVVRSRALVLDEMAARRRVFGGSADPEVRRLEEDLAAARTRLARLVVRGPGADHPETYRGLLFASRQGEEAAERALAEKSGRQRAEAVTAQASLPDLLRRLPADTALVSFCLYNRAPRAGRTYRASAATARPVPSYLVFVAPPGPGAPALIPLGEAREVEPLIARWKEEVSKGPIAAGRPPAEAVAAYRQAGDPLRRAVWDPVAARIGRAKRVFLVPDGALDLLSFASLPSAGESYLIETGPLIHHLSAEKDLLRFDGGGASGKGLLALGDPAFDETSRPVASTTGPTGSPDSTRTPRASADRVFRGERSACGDFQSLRFGPLPASGVEAREIAALWRDREPAPLLLVGSEATEASFKRSAAGRRILHLATHGFFLGGGCPPPVASSRGIGGVAPSEPGRLPIQAAENPLLESGLALAGANLRAQAGSDEEDGILTAEEIAALDLTGTQWVVLSGCDTAAGNIRAGEGVFGLRRAFHVAGAATLIMSLWAVEDEAARQWMKALYEARGEERHGTPESIRQASLDLIEEQRRRGRSTHPFYWAAFVAEGDWR